MERPDFRCPNVRALLVWFVLVIVLLVGARVASSEEVTARSSRNISRVDQVEQALQSVVEENRRLAEELDALKEQFSLNPPVEPAPSYLIASPVAMPSDSGGQTAYKTGYDKGFVIRPEDPDEPPFSLKINNQNTFRYSSFARDAASWTDSAGNVNPIFDSNAAMIPRGRLIFSGNAFLPQMSYLLNIDYNTVSSNPIGFRAYALSYQFGRALEVHVGQNKVPGSREWLTSSWDAQEGPDRSMATTFFRPVSVKGFGSRVSQSTDFITMRCCRTASIHST